MIRMFCSQVLANESLQAFPDGLAHDVLLLGLRQGVAETSDSSSTLNPFLVLVKCHQMGQQIGTEGPGSHHHKSQWH